MLFHVRRCLLKPTMPIDVKRAREVHKAGRGPVRLCSGGSPKPTCLAPKTLFLPQSCQTRVGTRNQYSKQLRRVNFGSPIQPCDFKIGKGGAHWSHPSFLVNLSQKVAALAPRDRSRPLCRNTRSKRRFAQNKKSVANRIGVSRYNPLDCYSAVYNRRSPAPGRASMLDPHEKQGYSRAN